MMKKVFLILVLFIVTSVGFGQSQKFFDSPFGGGGGFTPGWSFSKVSSLNSMLSQVGLPTVASSGIFTTGGAGFIYIGFVPGLRIGGMGYGGSTSSKGTITPIITGSRLVSAPYNVETDYSIGGGGLTIEYTLPFIKSMGVSLGAAIGGGSMTVELYRNGQNNNWGDIFKSASGNNDLDESHKTLKNNYWVISPTLNIDIPFYRFLCFRVGAGYNFTLGEEWKLDNDQSIAGVPSDFNGHSFYIQAGIFIGFFSF
ncbi:MAG: hypothetical protein P4L27_05590 [Ignavibacteriaceae bacterium]|nr:hypothetical protein [Ignavibacteriaceae bacterium]